ncbi:hypothetical protein [Acidiphilium acidophilum]|uniref:hypothetical protein n=1 Tax=Acidiphilium acidophilum TaxID=76588 RepID=UPI002E8E6F5B|nr:hypothetical protein [Acidiphilium acidophilum]
MTPNLQDIEAWAVEERGPPSASRRRGRPGMLDLLIDTIERDRKLPQPNALSAGSPERLAAEARQRRVSAVATTLGYQPVGREIIVEVVKHVGVAAAPIPEQVKPIAEVEISGAGESGDPEPAKRRAKKRERDAGGRELGFSL